MLPWHILTAYERFFLELDNSENVKLGPYKTIFISNMIEFTKTKVDFELSFFSKKNKYLLFYVI